MAGTIVADKWQNGDGTENFKCRAWVNFNGAGTVAIRASGNVSSITDNGSGDYTVNFTTVMPDANFTTVCSSRCNNLGADHGYIHPSYTINTSNIRLYMASANVGFHDKDLICCSIFR